MNAFKGSGILLGIFGLLLGLSIGFNFIQYQKISKNDFVNKINDERNNLNQDTINEVLLGYIADIRNNTIENAKQAGKLEGILAVAFRANPQENEHSAIWHGGYQRGLEQSEFIGEANYEKGYASGIVKGREEYLKSIGKILESKDDFKSALKDFVDNQAKSDLANNNQQQDKVPAKASNK